MLFHFRVNKIITQLSTWHLSSNLTSLTLTTVSKSCFYDPLLTPNVQEKGHGYGGLGWGSRWQVSLSALAQVPNGGAIGGSGSSLETCPLPRCYNQVVKHFGGQLAPGQGIALSRWFAGPINCPRWEAAARPQGQWWPVHWGL